MDLCGGVSIRLIPAYAGSTGKNLQVFFPLPAHPRIRGEHQYGASSFQTRCGSSPHTRGARDFAQYYQNLLRLIPAYAGSTEVAGRHLSRKPAHPRIRGEHRSEQLKLLFIIGSSPHTRGARAFLSPGRRSVRLIPAYAGSTRLRTFTLCRVPAHPRIRGEHVADWGRVGR